MSIEANIMIVFNTNEEAKEFRELLENEGYTDNDLDGTNIDVTVYFHGDRHLILSEAERRGAKVVRDNVLDDDN